ncbi:RNA polymerase sigma-70 factor [Pedobacter sp. ASV1-7]|uniref:RNA polymerase sigma-70 factor n=1 Tax=Pedobacter sp. ASV1-7 TaxID=3145237 RepID=UPI0032E930A3
MIEVSNTNEEELLLAFRSGDERAFDQVFRKFYAALVFFARRFMPLEGMAEEIVQDSLFKLWQKRVDFHSFISMKAFLYISTRNACLDGIDREKRKLNRDNHWFLETEHLESNVEELIIHTEVLQEIRNAIDLLPDQCRKIMKMSYEQSMSGKEIAEVMQITVSTVNNQKARGLSLLRKSLRENGFALFIILLGNDLLN